MYKKSLFTAVLLTTSLSSHAGLISVITGADMAGMKVTVTYTDTTTESTNWVLLSPGNGGTSTVDLETADGGAAGNGFGLRQAGNSLGNVDNMGTLADLSDDVFYGLWTLVNYSGQTITGFSVEALTAGVVFDTMFDNITINGSDKGRYFIAGPTDPSGATASYSDLYRDELYGTMTVSLLLADTESMTFFADTDAIAVSAPATISMLMLSLFGLVMNAHRKQA
jgi:hypothetical protein